MPVIDLTKTQGYKQMMKGQIQDQQALLQDLGFADADYDEQEYVLYHVLKDAAAFRSGMTGACGPRMELMNVVVAGLLRQQQAGAGKVFLPLWP